MSSFIKIGQLVQKYTFLGVRPPPPPRRRGSKFKKIKTIIGDIGVRNMLAKFGDNRTIYRQMGQGQLKMGLLSGRRDILQ